VVLVLSKFKLDFTEEIAQSTLSLRVGYGVANEVAKAVKVADGLLDRGRLPFAPIHVTLFCGRWRLPVFLGMRHRIVGLYVHFRVLG
jgi:hypothetical protein